MEVNASIMISDKYLNAVGAFNFNDFFAMNATIFQWHVDPVL